MNLTAKDVVIVGLGKSGIAAARLCRRLGARVIGTDTRPLSELPPEVTQLDIELRAGGHAGVPFGSAHCVVVSPGVPPLPELASAAREGVEVIGELELAYRQLARENPAAPIVAVGGTNGKSTTTMLAFELLSAGGGRVFVGGNLGTPASDAVGREFDSYVFEVSSFQLERAPSFRPRVSVLLNVSDDHLDRYSSFEEYAQAKGNAFANQTAEDVAVVPHGDALSERLARRGRGRVVTFGAQGDYVVAGRELEEVSTGARVSLESARLHGIHNLGNAAAAFAAARVMKTPLEAVQRGFEAFQPLPHRMALVGELGGVRFYDDSKATNVGAAVTALLGLSEDRGVLIAGGRDKLGSYEPLARALERKGRAVVVIGEAAERIATALGDRLPVERAADMPEAVARAFELARPGDAVLMSPACASFDMFKSYADRGDHFVRAFAALELRARKEGQGS
jgi:UDP-N-acetylmuramoylalanine--D-glutamate ligase